jgi:hypothetical protein
MQIGSTSPPVQTQTPYAAKVSTSPPPRANDGDADDCAPAAASAPSGTTATMGTQVNTYA